MLAVNRKFHRPRVAITLTVAVLVIASCHRRSSVVPDYDSIRDAKDWQNPFLIVEGNGVDIVLPDDRAHVSMNNLHDYLAQLPGRYWPYGKIVAIAEADIRSGNDDELIRQNYAQTKHIVESMGLRMKRW